MNTLKQHIIHSPFKTNCIKFRIRKRILKLAFTAYKNPFAAFSCLQNLMRKRQKIVGGFKISRYVQADNKYFYGLNAPGFPSPAFDLFIKNELNQVKQFQNIPFRLQTLIFSITKRCPLHCKHCFEWERVNQPESLSLDDLKLILKKFQDHGISQIQISGGEPLTRMKDLLQLLQSARPGSDFWILTSGYNLTEENALKLKQGGVNGINISLDHWQPEYHNQFRGHVKSFEWVIEGASNTLKADLALCLSLCATREFISEDNLMKYVEFAGELGAGFVQLLEPRQVGHFTDQDIELDDESIHILDNFYLTMNSDPQYRHLPVVMFPGYHQRRSGCLGAGLRYFYIDSMGNAHACPFCQSESGNIIDEPVKEIIHRLQYQKCHKFKMASAL